MTEGMIFLEILPADHDGFECVGPCSPGLVGIGFILTLGPLSV